ncbi:sporulation membrane protein YtaF [Ructibacterium gallinarum]|uniref:Sporulation membrane protein YtaF n=1 Tax=Ructibacterium gallinarum TaxID=2779355 RepID=A0A9D5R9A1_9FIRM|nr:sporulation membrane protein YtaF [Ructibacterium gallinarum]MBE5040812.1 sporulation membrane protein YtaF [Ructibacterium gallinarum]
MLSLLLIALSLCLDALGVGFAYGLRAIHIPLPSKILMSILSAFFALIAASLGKFLYAVLPPVAGSMIGIILLAGLGLYTILTSIHELYHPTPAKKVEKKQSQYRFVIDFLGLTVTIVRHPSTGDLDHSKTIDLKESFCIALALSLDSLGAGIGYGMADGSILLFPLFICIFQFFLITIGTFCGRYLNQRIKFRETILAFIPGIVMIGLAIMRLYSI